MTYLRMAGITKIYPGVIANDNVEFAVAEGEIHALVGENGAGKSTLMRILYGMEKPDAGQIFLKGKPVTIPSPQAAIQLGVDMVHQHFQLVPSMSVAENVTLGYEPRRGPFIDQRRMIEQVAELSQCYGLAVNPTARVADLSVGEQQRVEILKLLYRDARLLIMDEPSAVLTPQEVDELFSVLQRLVAHGRTVIFITHKLREVMAICQHATVLRGGRVVGQVNVAETTPQAIAQMMVGRDLHTVQRSRQPALAVQRPRLSVHGLSVRDDRDLITVRGVSFTILPGEIVGLAGVEGNGQRELLESLVGLRAPEQGEIRLGDTLETRQRSRTRRERGLAVIPEDRSRAGLSLASTLQENVISTCYYRPPISRWGLLFPGRIRSRAWDAIERYDIRVRGPNVRVRTLSGGNAQKVVVARELAEFPQVLVAAQPTRGLDIGATEFVHQELLRLRAEGCAVLLISADLDELLSLSDRLLVIFEGRIVGELTAEQATRDTLGLLMVGREHTGHAEAQAVT
jgi:simple sugar transport system ATP-binding protein